MRSEHKGKPLRIFFRPIVAHKHHIKNLENCKILPIHVIAFLFELRHNEA